MLDPFVGFEHSMHTKQAWRQNLPVLRLVQRGPEDRVALENPGKKADTLNQMLMNRNNTFIQLPKDSVGLQEKKKSFLVISPMTIYHVITKIWNNFPLSVDTWCLLDIYRDSAVTISVIV